MIFNFHYFKAALMDLNRLVFICRACLRLLVSFIHYIYPPLTPAPGKDGGQTPPGKPVTETQKLAECVFEVKFFFFNLQSTLRIISMFDL